MALHPSIMPSFRRPSRGPIAAPRAGLSAIDPDISPTRLPEEPLILDEPEVELIIGWIDGEPESFKQSVVPNEVTRRPVSRDKYCCLKLKRFTFISEKRYQCPFETAVFGAEPGLKSYDRPVPIQQTKGLRNLPFQDGPSGARVYLCEDGNPKSVGLDLDVNLCGTLLAGG